MRRSITAAIFASSTVLAANASAQTFTEISNNTGTYIADFGSVSGWKVIGLGTRELSACSAFKGELDSRRPATPYGLLNGYISLINIDTAFIFQRDEPYSLKQLDNPIRLHVSGRYGLSDDSYEWRWQGDKFFNSLERGGKYGIEQMRLTADELIPSEGRILDVKASSWEYPAINVGYSDDSGMLSVTGIQQVKAKIEACEKALIQEFPSHYENAVFSSAVSQPIVLPSVPQGWKKTDFGNYMAFKHEWLTFVYRKTTRGSDDTYFVVDLSQFKKLKPSERLELKIGDRTTYLSTSRYATNNFGDKMYPFTSLYLTPGDYAALNNGSLRIEAEYRDEKISFDITGFKQAEDYRVKWNRQNSKR
jgi:hypothetical protein